MNGCWATFEETQLATRLSSEDSAERLLFRGKKDQRAKMRPVSRERIHAQA